MHSTYGRVWVAATLLAAGCQLTSSLPRPIRASEAPLAPSPSRGPLPPPADAAVRPYLFFEPPVDGPVPLVLVLHGYTGSAEVVRDLFRPEEVAAKHGLAIAIPQGTRDDRGHRFWNATDACCNFGHAPVDDVLALRGVIAHVAGRRAIDRDRVAVVGYSNGAFMAHRLACDAAEELAAIVAVSGTGWQDPSRCRPATPVAVLQIHGDGDPVVRIDGGTVLSRADVAPHPSADLSARRWAARNGCSDPEDETGAFSGLPSHETTWSGCDAPVALWRVIGGHHVIGGDPSSIERIAHWLEVAWR